MLEVLPSILGSFATHGLKCEELAAKATQLATSASGIEHLDYLAPMAAYNDLLGEIGKRRNSLFLPLSKFTLVLFRDGL